MYKLWPIIIYSFTSLLFCSISFPMFHRQSLWRDKPRQYYFMSSVNKNGVLSFYISNGNTWPLRIQSLAIHFVYACISFSPRRLFLIISVGSKLYTETGAIMQNMQLTLHTFYTLILDLDAKHRDSTTEPQPWHVRCSGGEAANQSFWARRTNISLLLYFTLILKCIDREYFHCLLILAAYRKFIHFFLCSLSLSLACSISFCSAF